MTNNSIRRTVRMSILSMLFALVAFSFLAFGGASAHTISQGSNSTHRASSITTTTVHIRPTANGSFAIVPNAITVEVGTTVTIVNSTKVRQIIFSINPELFLVFAPGATQTITTQLGQEQLKLYGTLAALNIATVR